jgi:GT2 family glycosyltransferase
MVYGTWMNLVTNCVTSIVTNSTYENYEIVCVIDDAASPATRADLLRIGGDHLRLVPYSQPFNFSRKINIGALNAGGEYLLLLNDDTEVITPDWLQSLVMYAQQPDVGAVGGKLLFADGRIQHAGVVAIHGDPGHAFYGFPRDFEGYGANVLVPANCLAVTGACLMSRRDCFEAVGGLSLSFPLNYNDVDYCLKLWRAGYRVVFDPDVQMYHYESSSRITGDVEPRELNNLRNRWERVLRADPFYNPNLRLPDFLPPVNLAPVAG